MKKFLTLEEFRQALIDERGITLTRETLLRYLKAKRIKGAELGRDETGVRREWHIPQSAVKSFEPIKRGNPNIIGGKN